MPKIDYTTDGKVIEVKDSANILASSINNDIPHFNICRGNGRCSTCRVIILEGIENCSPRNELENKISMKLNFDNNIRLACQTNVKGDIKLRRLVLDDEDIKLTCQISNAFNSDSAGIEKKVVILFADIRNFTSFSEKVFPYDVIHFLNRYFMKMGEVVNRNNGYIDNYIGDGLLALFGTDDTKDPCYDAVKCGIDMLRTADKISEYMDSFFNAKLEIGIGIHYGEAVIGTIGSCNKRQKTVIGDSVNYASRIESANKELDTYFLVSEDVYQNVKNRVDIGKVSAIKLKGKTGDHKLYEIVNIK